MLKCGHVEMLNIWIAVSDIGGLSVSGVPGYSFACGRRPHATLNHRTEPGHRTVAPNMRIWIADSDIGGSPDGVLGPGPSHEETLPSAWGRPGLWVH